MKLHPVESVDRFMQFDVDRMKEQAGADPVDELLRLGMDVTDPQRAKSFLRALAEMQKQTRVPGWLLDKRDEATATVAASTPDGRPRRASDEGAENDALKLAVRALFELDSEHVLTVDDIKAMPFVRDWLAKRGVSDDYINRLIREVSPEYARPRRGPKDPWAKRGKPRIMRA